MSDVDSLFSVCLVCFSSDLRRRRDVTALYRRQRPNQVQLDEIHPLCQTLWGTEHDGCTVQVGMSLILSCKINKGPNCQYACEKVGKNR